jgi:hypothetical protein
MFNFQTNEEHYILVGGEPERCDEPMIWAKWCEETERRLGQTTVGPFEVVTVFTGVLVNGSLWKTTVSPPLVSGVSERDYATRAEARAGHDEMVAAALAAARIVDARPKVKSAEIQEAK